MHRIFTTSVVNVYPHYVAKVERKGRFKAELDQVVEWLTGYDQPALQERLETGTTFEAFFADAQLNPNASSITGVVCGVRVEHIEDPLMQKIRYLDKMVDELAKGRRSKSSGRLNDSRKRATPSRRSETHQSLRFFAIRGYQ